MTDLTAEFGIEFDRAIAETRSEFSKDDWLAAGYRPRQDESWWRERGPAMCNAFFEWYHSMPGLRIWVTPDRKPAIELEMHVMFGQIPVQMAPDVILQAGTALLIVDLKTGASTPGSRSQLGRYACGVEKTYGIRPRYGTFFLARGQSQKDGSKTYLLPPVTLDGPQYSCDFFTREFEMFDRAVNEGIFLPDPGKQCHTCGVNRACLAFGGEAAAMYQGDAIGR